MSTSTSTLHPSHKGSASCEKHQSQKQSRLNHAILNLPPSFFSINMGTGITSILLYNLPYNAEWLQIIGIIIFVLNVVIFTVLSIGNIVRFIMYKGLFRAVGKHPVSGMFWGTLPMGMATIINMIAFACVPAWGVHWARLALGLWWINVLMSILINFGMIFVMFARTKHTAEGVSAVWLLPIVSSVVAAASGGVVANAIMPFDPYLAKSTIIVAYVVWGTGVPIAMFIITLWIYRTALHGVPPAGALCSVFLPLGPCGQGSFGIALLGSVARDLAYEHSTSFSISPSSSSSSSQDSILRIADAIYAGGLITSLILWGLGLAWYLLGFAVVIDHYRKNRDFFFHGKFSVSLWAITFPIGVFATATTELAKQLDSTAFKVIGTFLSLQVTLHWVYVMIMSVWKVFDGTLFVAPEMAGFEDGVPPLRWGKKEQKEEGHCSV